MLPTKRNNDKNGANDCPVPKKREKLDPSDDRFYAFNLISSILNIINCLSFLILFSIMIIKIVYTLPFKYVY